MIRQGKEIRKSKITTQTFSAGKKVDLAMMFFLLLSFSLFVSCGKKATLPQGADQQTLSSDVIIGKVDWINLTSVKSEHPIYQQARAIGLISIPTKKSRCTAFLVSPDTIMTNWHCFPTQQDAIGARLYLDFLTGEGKESFIDTSSYDCDEWLLADENLDVALLRCEDNPGLKHGIVTLESKYRTRYIGDTVYVIHQNCDYYVNSQCAPTKKVSVGRLTDAGDAEEPARSQDYFYSADTLGGSSGSPVFSASTSNVMALHHNGHGQTYWSSGRGTRNSGVPMYKIVEFLTINHPEIVLQVESRE